MHHEPSVDQMFLFCFFLFLFQTQFVTPSPPIFLLGFFALVYNQLQLPAWHNPCLSHTVLSSEGTDSMSLNTRLLLPEGMKN